MVVNKDAGNEIWILEKNVWRSTFGPVMDADTQGWRRRKPNELRESYKGSRKIKVANEKKFQWTGDVVRADERTNTKTPQMEMKGRSGRGGPKWRYVLTVLGICIEDAAQDQKRWWGVIASFKVRIGLWQPQIASLGSVTNHSEVVWKNYKLAVHRYYRHNCLILSYSL